MVTKGEGGNKFEINIYILLYIKYKTRTYYIAQGTTHYLAITYNRKETEKEYICIKLYHFAIHQKLTQHCKSTILQ